MTDAIQKLIDAAQDAVKMLREDGNRYTANQLESAIAAVRQEAEPHIDGWPLYSGLPPPKAEPPEVRAAEPVTKIHIDHSLTDSEYILALIDETFSDVPQIKQHHVRMRGIAERLAHTPTAPSVPAPAAQSGSGSGVPAWINVADQMPGPGVTVLFGYRNGYGKWRTLRGHYSPLHTIEANDWDYGTPDETENGSFEPEGWWEVPVESETQNYVTDEVTHWMPLPAAPQPPKEKING
jgi:hypothetical protein